LSELDLYHTFATTYRFHIELDHLYVGGFSEASGLTVETEYEEYAEGGVNGFVHRFPSRIRHEPIVLKRGLTVSPILWEWFQKSLDGMVERKSGSIILLDENFEDWMIWDFYDAFPVKWIGPTLDASRSEVAIEQLEIVHQGLVLKYNKRKEELEQ